MVERNPRRWLILGVLCLTLLVVVVDNMVLNIAIPALIRDLGASTADIQWIIDAYILVFAGVLLTAGSLADRHGRRLGLVIGLIIFGGASALATVCESPGQLIAIRGLMGLGAAFLMPGTLAILTTVFDEDERKKAIAIWSSVLMLGALGGPTLGGLLLEHFWWGSVFLLNIPIAALGLLAALAFIPESKGPASRPDTVGALLSTIGMTALIWGVISAPEHGWESLRTSGGFVVALVALTGFILWERRVAEPMLPLELFRNRNFRGASLALVLLSFSAGGVMLAITQYLQFVLGYEPIQAGTAFIPMIVTTMVFNGVGVVVDKRFGARVALSAGLLLVAGGFAILASLDPQDGYLKLATALVVIGMGSGVAAPAAVGTLLGALPPERAGVGSAVNDTVQQVGTALSVAVLGSVLTTAYRAALPDGVSGPARESLGDALRAGDPGLADAARDAFVDAIAVTSLVGVVGGVAAAILAAAVLRPKPGTDPEAADPLSTEADAPNELSTDSESAPAGIERQY
ncbi:MFS transporter [Actinoplanes derwentensis]|uniref:Drug resistance transporter, EmrB/QacA subfamily n=1 Tax=Actinoplanes derwentensis TaxID=113562 RepID=A0A1H2D2A8_9ACTN|nr:MFS transporter [Actinoplanes derwentensis]GID86815.1 MFS transporter [Actinoplanes derwentensis]SDT76677.1 drug resistance transporter, EmrB/QacA subfamily [Actinoplanes derwentensis]